jgi:hypothetical protein
MNSFLTAGLTRGAAVVFALAAYAAGSSSARADYLVTTFADGAPAAACTQLPGGQPPLVTPEPFTVERPHADSLGRPAAELDEATLAAVQALLVCAIPPPVNTIITTTAPPPAPPPSVPAPPPFIPTPSVTNTVPVVPVPTAGGTSESPPEAPEPATLLMALVGSGLTGVALWRRGGRKRRRATAA